MKYVKNTHICDFSHFSPLFPTFPRSPSDFTVYRQNQLETAIFAVLPEIHAFSWILHISLSVKYLWESEFRVGSEISGELRGKLALCLQKKRLRGPPTPTCANLCTNCAGFLGSSRDRKTACAEFPGIPPPHPPRGACAHTRFLSLFPGCAGRAHTPEIAPKRAKKQPWSVCGHFNN